ncbi:MAG: hypothetical protein Q9182_001953, partial [Xanthomendoza sp. 2 TL-2023]
MAISYLNFPLISLFFLLCWFRQSSGHALPLNPPNLTDQPLVQPNHNISTPALNLQAQKTLSDAIDNLLHLLAAQEDIRFRDAALVSLNLYVNDQFSPYGPDRSRNPRAFRSLVTFFHIGGPEPAAPTPDGVCVRNQFPQQWDQWHNPFFVGDIPGREAGLHPFDWEQVWARMSLARADYLLKRAGYLGKYGQ